MVDERTVAFCEPSFEHPVAIVLGSGLGSLADRVRAVRRIPYDDIEGFPDEAIPVEGHRHGDRGNARGRPGRGVSRPRAPVSGVFRSGDLLGAPCAPSRMPRHHPHVRLGRSEPGGAGTVGLIADQINLTGDQPARGARQPGRRPRPRTRSSRWPAPTRPTSPISPGRRARRRACRSRTACTPGSWPHVRDGGRGSRPRYPGR